MNATLPLVAGYLERSNPKLELADCVGAVTYHSYSGGGIGPEENHAKIHGIGAEPASLCGSHPVPCSAVEMLDAVVQLHVPSAVVVQGEALRAPVAESACRVPFALRSAEYLVF